MFTFLNPNFGIPGPAKNDAGQATANLEFDVRVSVPENLKYERERVYFTNEPLSIEPTYDGVVDEFSITPSLPDGLAIDKQTGVIRGIPTAVTPPVTYTVTAKHETG